MHGQSKTNTDSKWSVSLGNFRDVQLFARSVFNVALARNSNSNIVKIRLKMLVNEREMHVIYECQLSVEEIQESLECLLKENNITDSAVNIYHVQVKTPVSFRLLECPIDNRKSKLRFVQFTFY